MANVLVLSGKEIPLPDDFDFSQFSSSLETEMILTGDVRLELIVENRQPKILLNGRDVSGRIEHCGLELIEHNSIDFTEHFNHGREKIVVLDTRENNFRDLVTPEILALIRACGGEPQIKIMAPVPDIRCDDHIYREEREFKKQKKEKFKSPMWNF